MAKDSRGSDSDDLIAHIRRVFTREADLAATSDFDLNPGTRLPEGARLRDAAVLIPLIAGPSGPQVLLTRRSARLKHHPGQIAFPGGKIDPEDSGPVAAALREAQEETGLDPAQVEVLGTMPAHRTVTGYSVTPVAGLIRGPFTPSCEPGEVAEAFLVPLSHLADLANYRVESRIWSGMPRHYYAVPWGPYYIWGATARILRAFAGRIA